MAEKLREVAAMIRSGEVPVWLPVLVVNCNGTSHEHRELRWWPQGRLAKALEDAAARLDGGA